MMAELIGHRGYPAIYPENTMLSFKKAIEAGCNGIELDVRLTRDNIVVVIHDKTLERTTNGKGLVNELTLKRLKELDAGKGEKIPTLKDVLEEILKVKFLIELKIDSEKNIERLCAETIKVAGKIEDIIFTSFSLDAIKIIKRINPRLQTGLIFSRPLPESESYVKFINALCPRRDVINSDIASFAKQFGIKTYVWTIDTKKELKEVERYGATGIVTNDPGTIKKLI